MEARQRRFFGEQHVEDSMLPVSGPDPVEASVLPADEFIGEDQQSSSEQTEDETPTDENQETTPESVLPDEEKHAE